MPQTISGATHRLESSQTAQPSHTVDVYADRLMNDLFEDVEDLLSGSVPPPEPMRIKPQPTQSTIATRTVAPLVVQPQLPQWRLPRTEANRSVVPNIVKPRSNRLQKILAVLFGLSALSAASIWMIQRGTAQRLFAMATQEPTTIATAPKAPPIDTTAKFARYMQRSLENLDRKVAENKPGTTTTLFNGKLPTTPIPGNAVARSTDQKQPIVINVPPAPTSTIPVATTNKTPQELDQVLTRLSSVLERLSINPPARSAIPAPAPIAIQPAQAASAEPQRTLRGIAIANDPTQSAILFEMNGVTQRYYIGESIGSSSWSVVDISNNYVSVRRNGEVRSISVGQKL